MKKGLILGGIVLVLLLISVGVGYSAGSLWGFSCDTQSDCDASAGLVCGPSNTGIGNAKYCMKGGGETCKTDNLCVGWLNGVKGSKGNCEKDKCVLDLGECYSGIQCVSGECKDNKGNLLTNPTEQQVDGKCVVIESSPLEGGESLGDPCDQLPGGCCDVDSDCDASKGFICQESHHFCQKAVNEPCSIPVDCITYNCVDSICKSKSAHYYGGECIGGKECLSGECVDYFCKPLPKGTIAEPCDTDFDCDDLLICKDYSDGNKLCAIPGDGVLGDPCGIFTGFKTCSTGYSCSGFWSGECKSEKNSPCYTPDDCTGDLICDILDTNTCKEPNIIPPGGVDDPCCLSEDEYVASLCNAAGAADCQEGFECVVSEKKPGEFGIDLVGNCKVKKLPSCDDDVDCLGGKVCDLKTKQCIDKPLVAQNPYLFVNAYNNINFEDKVTNFKLGETMYIRGQLLDLESSPTPMKNKNILVIFLDDMGSIMLEEISPYSSTYALVNDGEDISNFGVTDNEYAYVYFKRVLDDSSLLNVDKIKMVYGDGIIAVSQELDISITNNGFVCITDDDCEDGKICKEGECKFTDAVGCAPECEEGLVCVNKKCVPDDCDDITPCPVNYQCGVDNHCVPDGCDPACGSDETCVDDVCVPDDCDDITPCPVNYQCGVDNHCVPDDPTDYKCEGEEINGLLCNSKELCHYVVEEDPTKPTIQLPFTDSSIETSCCAPWYDDEATYPFWGTPNESARCLESSFDPLTGGVMYLQKGPCVDTDGNGIGEREDFLCNAAATGTGADLSAGACVSAGTATCKIFTGDIQKLSFYGWMGLFLAVIVVVGFYIIRKERMDKKRKRKKK